MPEYRIRFTNLNDLGGDHPTTHEFTEIDDSHARSYFTGFLDALNEPVNGFDDGVQADLETGEDEEAREV